MTAHSIALITGASSGIGAAYAQHLAARSHDLILVARRRERMEKQAAHLAMTYGVRVRVLTADLSTSSGIEQVEQYIATLDRLDMLINNAGFGTSGSFATCDMHRHQAMIDVHMTASVRFCHVGLPRMIKQHRGTIINVASIAAFLPGPGNTTYAATKSYLVTFSETLQMELMDMNETGIKIQALCPGFTSSEFHDTPEFATFARSGVPASMWMTSDEVVTASLKALTHKNVTYVPGWRNRLLIAISQSSIKTLLRPVMAAYRRRTGRQ